MTGAQRCDEVLRLIDEVLAALDQPSGAPADRAPARRPSSTARPRR